MLLKVNAGDKVMIEGEDGVWDVQQAGTHTPIVAITLNGNAATLRGVHVDKLTVQPLKQQAPFRLIPARGILD